MISFCSFCAWAVLPFLMNQSTHTCSKLVLPEYVCVCVCLWSAAAAACVRSLYGDLPQIGGHKHCKIISSLSPRLGQQGQTLVSFPRSFPTCRKKKYSAKCLSVCVQPPPLCFRFPLLPPPLLSLLLHLQFYLPWKPKTQEVVKTDPREREPRIRVQRGVRQVLTAFSILKYILCLSYDVN